MVIANLSAGRVSILTGLALSWYYFGALILAARHRLPLLSVKRSLIGVPTTRFCHCLKWKLGCVCRHVTGWELKGEREKAKS